MDPLNGTHPRSAATFRRGIRPSAPSRTVPAPHPSEQRAVAGAGRGERLDPEDVAIGVDDRCHVQILMRVDAPDDVALAWCHAPHVGSFPLSGSRHPLWPDARTGQSWGPLARLSSGHKRRSRRTPRAGCSRRPTCPGNDTEVEVVVGLERRLVGAVVLLYELGHLLIGNDELGDVVAAAPDLFSGGHPPSRGDGIAQERLGTPSADTELSLLVDVMGALLRLVGGPQRLRGSSPRRRPP